MYGSYRLLLAWFIHIWKKTPRVLNIAKKKVFRRTNILIMSIISIFLPSHFRIFGHPVWLKQSFISLVYPFLKKAPKMLIIKEVTLFRRPNILIRHSENVLQELPSIFWTPCMAKIDFYQLGLSIFVKRLLKCSTSQRKNFSDTHYFDHTHISSFLHTKIAYFHFFQTPCMAMIAFY